MARTDAPPAFWLCRYCGTPNPGADYLTRCVGCGAERPSPGRAGPRPPGRTRRPTSPRRARLGRRVSATCWAYAAGLLALVALVWTLGDRCWPATALMFGPRWPWGLPLAPLIPAALILRPRALAPLLAAAVLFVGPWMGLRVPLRAGRIAAGGGLELRVLTCNVHFATLDQAALAGLILREGPDVVLLQEWNAGYKLDGLFLMPGWQVRADGEFVLASRFPIDSADAVGRDVWGFPTTAIRATLRTPKGPIQVVCVHPVSPRYGLLALIPNPFRGADYMQANTLLRRTESQQVSAWVGAIADPVIVAGDFNLPPESAIFRDYWSRYTDAFDAAGVGLGHTWLSRWHGLRIDHILAGPGWRVRRCRVGSDVGSDHRPLLADLVLVGGE